MQVRILKNVNLIPALDELLPFYIKKSSAHVEWDVNFFPLSDVNNPRETTGPSYYLTRKIKNSKNYNEFPNPYGSNIAIVLQGPIVSKNSITLRIIQHYFVRYPEVCIVVSTWEDTAASDIAPFVELAKKEKIRLVLNPDPEYPGVFNINRQIISSRNGLSSVLEDFEYAIKSRTDQVFIAPRFMNHLQTLLNRYSNNFFDQEKIVISSFNTFAFRLYGASDMFQFGKTKNLFDYWNQPLDNRDISDLTKVSPNLKEEARKRIAEVYLNTNYFIEKLKKEPNYEFIESLDFIAHYFIVADANSLGQKWFKYTNLSNRWGVGKFPNRSYEMTHIDWIGLQDNFEAWQQYEESVNSKAFYLDE
jgi:hypothetical protein